MPLHIEDEEAAQLVIELAERLKTTNLEAVKGAVRAQLDRLPRERAFRERLLEFYDEFPLPEPTGKKADKAFFDELSGDPP